MNAFLLLAVIMIYVAISLLTDEPPISVAE